MSDCDLWEIQREYHSRGYELICGVDEAGRGPLAGPVYAAAVILPKDLQIEGLNDSKKLTEARREALFEVITKEAVACAIAFATVEEIEQINILKASCLAMKRAVDALAVKPHLALIDGNRAEGIPVPFETIVKGDARCASIAAASILAKVARDRHMVEMSMRYPEYQFEIHKGYGTKRHYQAILEYGVTPIHRMSFLKNLEDKRTMCNV